MFLKESKADPNTELSEQNNMRRRAAPKRKVIPDSKYESEIVAKFMNQLMVDGKKSIAEKIVYGAFDQLEKSSKESPVDTFKKVLDKVAPVVEVRSCLLYTSPSPRDRG